MLFALGGVLQATAATEEEMLAVHQATTEAFNAHDVEQFLSYLTEDAIHDYVPAPAPVTGKEENRAFMTDVFQTFPDAKLTTQRVLTSGNILVNEWIFTGTLEGEWMGMGPTGKGGPTPHLTISEFEGDKVKRMTTYFDMVTFMVNSGLMPTPELPELVPSFTLPDPEATGLSTLEVYAEQTARWNSFNLSHWANMHHPDADFLIGPLGVPLNRDSNIAAHELYLLGMQDRQQETLRAVDLGDGWILAEMIFTGTNDGPYFGIPATGRPFTVRGGQINHIDADGLITYQHSYFDNLTVLTQIGAFPPLPPLPEYPPIPDYLVQDEITSPSLEGNLLGDAATRDVLVYLPLSYETSPDKHYPTIYLLHGYTGDHRLFVFTLNVAMQSLIGIDLGVDIGDIVNSLMATGDLGEVIIVLPDAKNVYGGSWYERSEVLGDYRDYIARDLVEYIDGKYRTIPDREHRAITGHSMGGYGALSLAIEYNDVFGSVASLSPGFPNDVEVSPTAIEQFIAENPDTLGEPILISSDEDMWRMYLTNFQTNVMYSTAAAYSPNPNNPPYYVDLPVQYPDQTVVPEVWEKWKERDLVAQIERDGANLSDTAIFIDQGVGETILMVEVPGVAKTLAALGAQGIPYTYDEFDGDHLTHLRYQLESALKFLYPHIALPADTEANKALTRRIYEEIVNQKNLDIVDEVFAPDHVEHMPPNPDIHGSEGMKQFFAMLFAGFPDIQFTVEDQIAEGDMVATRWINTGTHQGEFMDIPPTGAQAVTTGVCIFRIENGVIVEDWTNADFLGLMQQLGVIDPMGRQDFSWGEPSEVTGEPGNPEENKAIVMRYVEEFWNQKNLDVLDELISPSAIAHEATTVHLFGQGLESLKQAAAMYIAAFPDLHVTVDDLIAEGDMVVERWTCTATNQGELMGIPPSGKQVAWTGITMYRFADGKIVEHWWAWDALGLMQQLTPPEVPTEGYDNVFFMSLSPGLNMVSLPLKPQTPYTASSFAEELSATTVITLDEARQRFIGFTLDAPDDGFAIEGGKGYIVNVPEAKVVAFTGAAWTNQPPVEAAPALDQNDGAWAFVVSGRLFDDSDDTLRKDGYLVTVRNTRTNAVAVDTVRSRYFAAAFADLNRKNVVQTGDRLELQLRNRAGEIVSDTLSYTVTSETIRQAFMPLTLRNVEIPRQNLLLPNYPNPFNPETWIPYQIREPADVMIRLYNAKGQLVRTLDLGQRAAGFYLGHTRAAHWDGHNDAGEKVASGIYFYQIKAGDFSATRRMLIVK